MKKRFLTIACSIVVLNLCLLQYANSQEGTSGHFQNEIPNITPVSPEASAFARYGDVALNSATGQMSYSVPLYTVNVDGGSLPVVLNYNYSGLILEGKPSLSGLGWHLSAGASITKEVRGLPDGHPSGYYGANNIKAEIDNIVADHIDGGTFLNATPYYKLDNFMNGQWDTEVDKYTVNIAGSRFSFKLRKDENGNAVPYFLSKHNHKVSITMDSTQYFEVASFVVTAADGTTYYFDANHRERVVAEPAANDLFWEDKTTAWMLSKIEYINKQEISFEYDTDTYESWDFSAIAVENDIYTDIDAPTHPDVQQWNQGYSDEVRRTELERKILRTITFEGGSVHFNTTTSGRKLYNDVQVKNIQNSTILSYNFSYTGNRDALVDITRNNEPYYGFEYYNIHTPGTIPGFFNSFIDKPYDQDNWKYYNAAGNDRAIYMPYYGTQYHVDKAPDFVATRTGALKRIIYPTKGHTEVIYEQNQVKKPYDEGVGSVDGQWNGKVHITLDARTSNSQRHISMSKTFDHPVRASLFHKIIGNVDHGNGVTLSIQKTGGTHNPYNECYSSDIATSSYYPIVIADARTKMINDINPTTGEYVCPYYPNPILAPYLLVGLDPGEQCPWYFVDNDFGAAMGCTSETTINQHGTSGGDFWVSPGTYEFRIDVSHLAYDNIFAEIRLDFYDPALNNGGDLPEFVNVDVGGIRVKQLIDYGTEGNYSKTKHYKYNTNDREEFSTARLNQVPLFTNRHIWNHTNSSQNPPVWQSVQIQYLLNSYTATNINQGTPVYYRSITSHTTSTPGQSGYPNGYTIQDFYLPYESLAYQYPHIPKGEDISKALPKQTLIKNEENSEVSISNNFYTPFRHLLQHGTTIDDNNDHPWSFKLLKKLEVSVNWDTGCFDNANPTLGSCDDLALKTLLDMTLYKEVDLYRSISSESSTTQDVSISKEYVYNSHYQLESVSTSNSLGETLKTTYEYPYDISETQYIEMITKNQLSTPVREKSFIDDQQLYQKKTNFIQPASDMGYLPHTTYVAKDSNVATEQLQINYYADGKIKEYISHEGHSPNTVFIWGYNKTYPIAKIENATYTTVQGFISNLQSLSNADDDRTLGYTGHEGALRQALDNLRTSPSLSGAMISTYTYDPLIGVTSMTDPRGYTMYYEYDDFNRLKLVKDQDGNILSENQYHYQN